MGTPQATIQSWQHAVARDPGSDAFVPLADLYRAQGRFELARSICLHGLDRQPNHVEGRFLLGRIHHEEGDPERARAAWGSALALDPDHAGARRALGLGLEGAEGEVGAPAALDDRSGVVSEGQVLYAEPGASEREGALGGPAVLEGDSGMVPEGPALAAEPGRSEAEGALGGPAVLDGDSGVAFEEQALAEPAAFSGEGELGGPAVLEGASGMASEGQAQAAEPGAPEVVGELGGSPALESDSGMGPPEGQELAAEPARSEAEGALGGPVVLEGDSGMVPEDQEFAAEPGRSKVVGELGRPPALESDSGMVPEDQELAAEPARSEVVGKLGRPPALDGDSGMGPDDQAQATEPGAPEAEGELGGLAAREGAPGNAPQRRRLGGITLQLRAADRRDPDREPSGAAAATPPASAAEFWAALAPHLEAEMERSMGQTGVSRMLLIDLSGRIIAQRGFQAESPLAALASLVAGIHAASGQMARMLGQPPFRHLYQGQGAHQLFAGLVESPAGALLAISSFGEESTIGLVRALFPEFARRILESRWPHERMVYSAGALEEELASGLARARSQAERHVEGR